MTPLTPTTRKAATMDTPKPPSKRWRLAIYPAYGGRTVDYASKRKAYDALNELHNDKADIGARVNIRYWESGGPVGGQWALYERAVITENGWEPA